MSERTFNFYGSGMTFNDIHDNHNCTIVTGQGSDTDHEEAEEVPGIEAEAFLWPYYRETASVEDKRDFEHFLRSLATSGRRSATADIKAYLQMKVQAGLIVRPTQTNVEYELVCRFGYPRQAKTYYNA